MTTTTTLAPDDAQLDDGALAAMALRAANAINLRRYRGDDLMRQTVWRLRHAATELHELLIERERRGAA